MPLPAALLKKLTKRGIVEKNDVGKRNIAPAEEIIAEDYDEVDEPYDYEYKPTKKPTENYWSERLKRRITDGNVAGCAGCPNKYNIHHKCSLYCINKHGDGIKEISNEYNRRKFRLLKRYPLPRDWKEIFDNGCGVHYYWNVIDDTVCWLPPSHPKAVVTKCAALLRKELEALLPDNDDRDDVANPDMEEMDFDMQNIQDYVNEREFVPPQPKIIKKPKARDLERTLKSKSERRQRMEGKKEVLDPMDPAAYSDIPRGKWSAGLEHENTKTGVDSTVTGTAFQMRPYPSPGMVLQANAGGKRNDDEPNDNNSDSD